MATRAQPHAAQIRPVAVSQEAPLHLASADQFQLYRNLGRCHILRPAAQNRPGLVDVTTQCPQYACNWLYTRPRSYARLEPGQIYPSSTTGRQGACAAVSGALAAFWNSARQPLSRKLSTGVFSAKSNA